MGGLTLVALLILMIVVGVIANDYSQMQGARRREEDRTRELERTGGTPLPIYGNDPLLTALQSQAETIARITGATVGGAAGAGVGRAAGTAISAAEVELARGLGSHDISSRESRELTGKSAAAASSGGGAVGANLGGFGGGFGGGLLTSIPLAFLEQGANVAAHYGGRVAEGLAEATPSRQLYDVPYVGGVFRWSDDLFRGLKP